MPDVNPQDLINGNPSPQSVDLTGLSQSRYNFNYMMFPSDLTASTYGGHYMVININVPTNPFTNNPRSAFPVQLMGGDMSKVDTLKYGTAQQQAEYGFSTPNGVPQRESLSVPRFTRRIATSIALFMPSSIIHTNQNIYEEVSLTALGGRVASVGLAALVSAGGALAGRSVQSAAAAGLGAARIADASGRVLSQVAALAKYPINPRVEILFSTTPQKQYVFEVLMAPRNEYESEAIKQIVKTLRFYSAPQIGSGTGGPDGVTGAIAGGLTGAGLGALTGGLGGAAIGALAGLGLGGLAGSLGPGLTFVPPSEFDITFYQGGRENRNIPRINTCVMEKIEVDYSPTGGIFSTFRNGHPVAVRLSMAFREVEIPHALRIDQGF